MKHAKLLAGIAAASLLAAYVGSFCAVINVLDLSYIKKGDGDPAHGYYFACDPIANRCFYYFYYPLAKCFEWVADAAFFEQDPFGD